MSGAAGGGALKDTDEVVNSTFAHLGVEPPVTSKKNSMLGGLPNLQSQGNSVSDTFGGRNMPNRPSLCAIDSIGRPSQLFTRGAQ